MCLLYHALYKSMRPNSLHTEKTRLARGQIQYNTDSSLRNINGTGARHQKAELAEFYTTCKKEIKFGTVFGVGANSNLYEVVGRCQEKIES